MSSTLHLFSSESTHLSPAIVQAVPASCTSAAVCEFPTSSGVFFWMFQGFPKHTNITMLIERLNKA